MKVLVAQSYLTVTLWTVALRVGGISSVHGIFQCPHYHPLTWSCNACGYGQIPADVAQKKHRHLVAEGQRAVHVQTVITFQFQQGVSEQFLFTCEREEREKRRPQ